MNISEVIKNRTSLRVYDDRMIEDQDLEKILEAASLAPTAGNQQLYSIIVIKSQETERQTGGDLRPPAIYRQGAGPSPVCFRSEKMV